MAADKPSAAHEENPGLGLAATLGLIALFFLPLMNGGYSSGGAFQVGFVLLPLAAGLAWVSCPRRPPGHTTAIILIFLLLGLPGMLFMSQGGREVWYYAMQMIAGGIIVWVTMRHVPDRARLLWPVVAGSAVLTALYGWYLWLGSGLVSYQITSTFGLHNPLAGYLLLAWPAALIAAHEAVRTIWRYVYAAAAVFLVLTLVLTYSRASWVVMVLQLTALAIWVVWHHKAIGPATNRLLAIFGGVVTAATVSLVLIPGVRDALSRVFDFQGYSFQGRLRFWDAALEMFARHPMGVGLGNYANYYPQFQKDYIYYSIDPHSWPLQLISELGVFGILILGGVLCGLGWWIRRLWRVTKGGAVAMLLITAVVGSLVHAAVDFDYYFGAVTSLLGVLVAYGAHLLMPPEPAAPDAEVTDKQRRARVMERLRAMIVLAMLLLAAGVGEMLTLERYPLDHLRDNPGLQPPARLALLEKAISHNRFNGRTHYQLASILAAPGPLRDVERAREEVELCLRLQGRNYSPGWALMGLLSEDPAQANTHLEQALELDPYNHPEYYFYYANLAPDDVTKRERLLAGLERIPAHHPVKPDHVRPTWHELNPLWAEWYYELARLTEDPDEKDLYRKRGASFQAYWESVLSEREGE